MPHIWSSVACQGGRDCLNLVTCTFGPEELLQAQAPCRLFACPIGYSAHSVGPVSVLVNLRSQRAIPILRFHNFNNCSFLSAVLVITVIQLCILYNVLLFSSSDTDPVSAALFLDFLLFVLISIGLVSLGRAIRWLYSRYLMLSIYVLLLPEATRGAKLPSGAVWSFALFIINLIVCALWYCFGYDPIGTVNPSWTGIFG